jgi:hypothetical protein
MSVAFYMDEHVPGPITRGLRRRGVDVLTAQEDRLERAKDDTLLDRASALGRLLVSTDEDYFKIVARRQALQTPFTGVISLPSTMPYRAAIEHLEMIAMCSDQSEWEGKITRLPF